MLISANCGGSQSLSDFIHSLIERSEKQFHPLRSRQTEHVMQNFAVVPYAPHLSSTFAEIWVPWLKSVTGKDPEPEDLIAVHDPETFYISKGGAVFFAITEGKPIAVVAVKNLNDGVYEFCKLVVLDSARGSGAGRAMVQACIEFTRQQGGRVLMLQSFKRLTVALDMYSRMGFVSMAPPAQMLVLARTEVVMGMILDGASPKSTIR